METTIIRDTLTIFATDCVGFSRHMEESEEGTLINLKKCRSVIDPIIHTHNGRIFHTAGDSVIAEFSSPVACVQAAIAVQKQIVALNQKLTSGPKLQWRIGAHVDDVIVEKENIFGRGVNIAARLESLCTPGQILLSRKLTEEVQEQIEPTIYPAGTRVLKNISDNYEVFCITMHDGPPDSSVGTSSSAKAASKAKQQKNHKPKIAVIPFVNRNQSEDSGFLVDGIVEDIITEFSMIRELEIVSRQTSFDFRNKELELHDFIQQFELDYVVSGSIRTAGKRVRISVELLDTHDDKVVWSKKYDRVMDDIFDVQDEIVRKITIALMGEIELASLQRAKRKPTENMSSYEFLLRGKELHHRFEQQSNGQALGMFDQAIKADPNNAQAYAWKACTMGQAIGRGYIEGTPEVFSEAMTLIDNAIELNEKDLECHRLLAEIHLATQKFTLAKKHARTALRISPNDPRILSVNGEILLRTGSFTQGLSYLEKAYELDPIPQGQVTSDRRVAALFAGYFMAGQYYKCEDLFDEFDNVDKRSWLMMAHIQHKQQQPYDSRKWFRNGLDSYRQLNWETEVGRFNLNNQALTEELLGFANQLVQSAS